MDDREIDCPYCVKPEASCECRWFPQNCPARPTLTPKQAAVLLFIHDYAETKGHSPSIRDIGERFKHGPNGAKCHIDALVKKGYLGRGTKQQGRAIGVLALPQ
jgi:SOS-response transcriptional repressor LexA